jgi:hypothetical protein
MDIKLAILASIALAAALQLQSHRPYVSTDWLTGRSSGQSLCAAVHLERGCEPFVERSRWTRPQAAQAVQAQLVSSR